MRMRFKAHEACHQRDADFIHALLGLHLHVGHTVTPVDVAVIKRGLVGYLAAVRAGRVPSDDIIGGNRRHNQV